LQGYKIDLDDEESYVLHPVFGRPKSEARGGDRWAGPLRALAVVARTRRLSVVAAAADDPLPTP